jgi:hypothetical protein
MSYWTWRILTHFFSLDCRGVFVATQHGDAAEVVRPEKRVLPVPEWRGKQPQQQSGPQSNQQHVQPSERQVSVLFASLRMGKFLVIILILFSGETIFVEYRYRNVFFVLYLNFYKEHLRTATEMDNYYCIQLTVTYKRFLVYFLPRFTFNYYNCHLKRILIQTDDIWHRVKVERYHHQFWLASAMILVFYWWSLFPDHSQLFPWQN